MHHSPSHRIRLWADRLVPGLFAASLLAALASGCTGREDADRETTSQATARPTGQELFVEMCAPCHGADARGDGPLASEFKESPPNLRLLKQANEGKFSVMAVQRAIDGRGMPRAHGLPDMPVWGRQWLWDGLNEAETQARALAIASYLSSIQE